MRLLKNSFAVFFALLAISATLASYAGVFGSTKLAPPEPGCYRVITNEPLPEECGDLTTPICVTVLTASQPGSCPVITEDACCFVVEENAEECNPGDGVLVTSVACGEFEAD